LLEIVRVAVSKPSKIESSTGTIVMVAEREPAGMTTRPAAFLTSCDNRQSPPKALAPLPALHISE